MATQQSEAARKYIEAERAAQEHARKEGTPEYDPRAHQHALELERKAKERLAAEGHPSV